MYRGERDAALARAEAAYEALDESPGPEAAPTLSELDAEALILRAEELEERLRVRLAASGATEKAASPEAALLEARRAYGAALDQWSTAARRLRAANAEALVKDRPHSPTPDLAGYAEATSALRERTAHMLELLGDAEVIPEARTRLRPQVAPPGPTDEPLALPAVLSFDNYMPWLLFGVIPAITLLAIMAFNFSFWIVAVAWVTTFYMGVGSRELRLTSKGLLVKGPFSEETLPFADVRAFLVERGPARLRVHVDCAAADPGARGEAVRTLRFSAWNFDPSGQREVALQAFLRAVGARKGTPKNPD